MGKKIRIVLLTVTAVAAVFSFALMLDVRPGSDSTVLNAAKDRQSEPLLSVSEPLETDPGTIAAEEEMAEKVKGILLADDEFIGSISDQIYDGVPEMVNSWLAGEEGAAILQTLQDNGVDEAVARIVTEENINAIAERVAANLGTNDSEAFAAAADRLARTVASQIIIPQIQREVARNTVIDLYNANKDVIADDVIRRAVAEYASLTDAEKLELLSLDSIYYKYSDGMFADALKALEALPAEEKKIILDELKASLSASSEASWDGLFLTRTGVARRCLEEHGDDIGCLFPYLLNVVHLRVGEALPIVPDTLHAYVFGNGVELMDASDNVLRGGLTPKRIDLPELERIMSFDEYDAVKCKTSEDGFGRRCYSSPSPDFRLLSAGTGLYEIKDDSIAIAIVTEGNVRFASKGETMTISKGEAVVIPAGLEYSMNVSGEIFISEVPDVE